MTVRFGVVPVLVDTAAMAPTLSQAICGFYAVIDRDDPMLAGQLLDAGARVLQVRCKPIDPLPTGEVVRIARWARALTRKYDAALVINDRLDIAIVVGADGVHLGQEDLGLADARELLAARGQSMWIGISTHNLVQVNAAVAGGADYLGYGPVFATSTKRNADPVRGLDELAQAVRAAGGVPVVGIGGVTAASAGDIFAAGAAAACVISAVNQAPDPVVAGRAVGAPWRRMQSP